MSDRLIISASFSVLMMALYVLFGENVVRVPFGPSQLALETEFGGSIKTSEFPGGSVWTISRPDISH